MEDSSLTFIDIVFRIAMVLLIYCFGFMVALSGDSNQETRIKELKQKIEIIELNKKLLKLKEVK